MAVEIDRTTALLEAMTGLYQQDPEAFEACRRELLELALESYPAWWRPRARGLQFVIESQLNRCHDPVSRLNCMVAMFWEGVAQFQAVLSHPEQALARRERKPPAKVVPLRPPGTLH